VRRRARAGDNGAQGDEQRPAAGPQVTDAVVATRRAARGRHQPGVLGATVVVLEATIGLVGQNVRMHGRFLL
jgi:hypothetical protein